MGQVLGDRKPRRVGRTSDRGVASLFHRFAVQDDAFRLPGPEAPGPPPFDPRPASHRE